MCITSDLPHKCVLPGNVKSTTGRFSFRIKISHLSGTLMAEQSLLQEERPSLTLPQSPFSTISCCLCHSSLQIQVTGKTCQITTEPVKFQIVVFTAKITVKKTLITREIQKRVDKSVKDRPTDQTIIEVFFYLKKNKTIR